MADIQTNIVDKNTALKELNILKRKFDEANLNSDSTPISPEQMQEYDVKIKSTINKYIKDSINVGVTPGEVLEIFQNQ